MKKFKVKIGQVVGMDIYAKNKGVARELGFFYYDQRQADELDISIDVKEIKEDK